ncbi:MAG: sigma-70 family RNA polymerase sigma factor [Pseudomonadota bacterium]
MTKSTTGEADGPQDSDLLAAVAQGDRDSFAIFFGRYAARVKAFLIRSGTKVEEAEELSQDVMVTVWRKAASFDPTKASAATWLFTIARNRRIDLARRHARPAPDPEDPLFQPDPDPDGADILGRRQRDAALRAALAELPENQRDVVTIAFFEGLSQSEIAARLDLPLGTVKSRSRLALSRLRAALGEPFRDELDDG